MAITIIAQNLQIYSVSIKRINKTTPTTAKVDLPIVVRKVILPIYQSFYTFEMLEKSLHGKTQNANESFSGMIWNCVPEVAHFELDVLAVGVYDAIAHFNNGEKAALDIMKLLKVNPGYYMAKSCGSSNMHRIRSSIHRMAEPQKKCQKVLCHSKKKQQDKNIETEGTSYEKEELSKSSTS